MGSNPTSGTIDRVDSTDTAVDELATIREEAVAAIAAARTLDDLERVRVTVLGRKGSVTGFLRVLGSLSLDEKRSIGPQVQALRALVEEALEAHRQAIMQHAQQAGGASGARIDLTRPARRLERGHLHPLTLTAQRVREIFARMNFAVIDGPEIDTEQYNFDVLNIPAHHPARDMWDTFWMKPTGPRTADRLLMRTHTSNMQVRYMEAHQPPFQVLSLGRAFRYEATDATHEINFHQVEGFVVGKAISFANFRAVIEQFLTAFFEEAVTFRYRASYFPFVEPGVEVDIKLGGKWLEVMGAGMIHPRVFEAAGYNPRDYTGFAFGAGLERLAMIKYGVSDIRLFYNGDTRFVRQFS